MSVHEKMTAIADAIRAKTGGTAPLTLDAMAMEISGISGGEDLDDVLTKQEGLIEELKAVLAEKASRDLDEVIAEQASLIAELEAVLAEKASVGSEALDAAYEAGVKSEYDRFWDDYQNNGNLNRYEYAFAGMGWTDELFKPKYDIITTGWSAYMFRTTQITDIVANTIDRGIKLDTNGATALNEMFAYASYLKRVPPLDFSNCGEASAVFIYCNVLETIMKLIVHENLKWYKSCFQNCRALVNLTIEGTIGTNNFDVQWSTKLSRASITSIINALSTTTSGLTVTLSKTAVNTAFETASGAADGNTSADWLALVATKPNWTISLV